jgi:hypothetical protein
MSDKLQVNMDDLTFRELDQIRKLAGAPLEELMAGEDQALGLVAIVCVMQRRTIPDFSLDDAWEMRVADVDMVTADPLVGTNGDTPRPSPESGT